MKNLPIFATLFAALMWGLWWAPIRWLDALGLSGIWASVVMSAGSFLAMLIWLLWSRKPLKIERLPTIGAIFVALAITTYSLSLVYGDVVRAILLFYLAPAWSKLIEWKVFGHPWKWTSSCALILSFAGLFCVVGSDYHSTALGVGDILAIISGMSWAIGAAFLFKAETNDAGTLTLSASAAATVIGLLYVLVAPNQSQAAASGFAWGTGMGVGAAYMLPILVLTLWSAQRLPPATVSFILTAEVLSGVISSAIWLDESFDALKVIGTVLIITAALTEVLTNKQQKLSD